MSMSSEASSRWIVLDTETTGIDPRSGDRVIEIGCVEIVERRKTGSNFHAYLNADRDSEEGALNVHGLTREFLADKPRFAEVAAKLIEYLDLESGAEVVIHNAAFDVGFLDAEFARLRPGGEPFSESLNVVDSLQVARERHPGQANSLNALCKRYGVDASARTLHGALLDAELLADVYLALTAGQAALSLDLAVESVGERLSAVANRLPRRQISVGADDLAGHRVRVAELSKIVGGASIWEQLQDSQ